MNLVGTQFNLSHCSAGVAPSEMSVVGKWGWGALPRRESLCSWTFWVPLDLPHCVTLERSLLGFSFLFCRFCLVFLTLQGCCEWSDR